MTNPSAPVLIPEGTKCRQNGCIRDAEEILFTTGKFELFGKLVEKEVQIPLCKPCHTEVISSALGGVSIGEPVPTEPQGRSVGSTDSVLD